MKIQDVVAIEPSLEQILYDQIKSKTHVKVRIYGDNKELIDYKWVPKLDYFPTHRDNAIAFINKLSDISLPRYRGVYAGLLRDANKCFSLSGDHLIGHRLSVKQSNMIYKFCHKKFALPQFMLDILTNEEPIAVLPKKEMKKLYKKSIDRDLHWEKLDSLLPSLDAIY